MSKDFQKKEYWFPAKKYGYGWGLPITWQGWVVVMAYFVLVIGSLFFLHVHTESGRFQYVLFTIFLSVVLIAICWLKGEPAKWRWGNRDA